MSEATYYWPDAPGDYILESGTQSEGWWHFDGRCWSRKQFAQSQFPVHELVSYGYLGVRREAEKAVEKPAGVQSRTDGTCHWPESPGKYTVLYRTGYGVLEAQDVERVESGWLIGRDAVPATNHEMEQHGFIGVSKPPKNDLLPDPDDGNAMVAQQALDELRACRKSYEYERWSLKWGNPLCEIAGAR